MQSEYVERRPDGFYLLDSRVALDYVVREYWNGEPPESIRQHFPTLTLEQVFGALAFYLANKDEVDASIRERDRVENTFASPTPIPDELRRRIQQARQPVRRA